jgi:antitoxin component of MazEF toxin-antitoxin module
MNTIIEKRGNSFFLKIPDIFAEKINLVEKTDVKLSIEGDNIVIKPVSKPQYTSGELSERDDGL